MSKIIKGLKKPHRVPPYLHKQIIKRYLANRYEELVLDSEELKHRAERLWVFDEDTSQLGPELAEELAPLRGEDSITYSFRPSYLFKEPFVCELRDVTVAGSYATAQTFDGKFVADTISFDPYDEAYDSNRMNGAIEKTIRATDPFLFKALRGTPPQAADSVDVATVLHRPSNNYYHWMLEHCLKLRGVERYEAETGNNVTLIIPSNPTDWIKESIEILGFGDHTMIEWNERKSISVNKLVVPSFPEPTPNTLSWTRQRMLENINTRNKSDDVAGVYVSRQNSQRGRCVSNFDEVRDVLERYNIEIVCCEELSVKEQVIMFNKANVIIGPHGAGLTNIIWGENKHVIELFNGWVSTPYYILSHILGDKYDGILAEPDNSANRTDRRNWDLIVDADELADRL